MIIAIDGPAAAGKSTVARLLAKKLGFVYIDTGALYRALTLKALQNNIDLSNEAELIRMSRNTQLILSNNKDGSIKIILDGKDVSQEIRSARVSQYVSHIAKIKGVREELLELQRSLGRANDSVLEGRDIGTVVFPDADKKFYLDAQFSVRVKRRFKELRESGAPILQHEVEADLRKRDYIDSSRKYAPLRKADDAIYIDTTNMTVEEVLNTILKEIKK